MAEQDTPLDPARDDRTQSTARAGSVSNPRRVRL